MSNYFRIIDQCPDGATLGDTSGVKWAAHGATPVAQQYIGAAVTLSVTDAGGAADATALRNAVNLMQAALINKGIGIAS